MVKKVSLKEQVADFDPQPVITKDNVTMQIDTVIYFQITDPKLYTYGVEHPMNAIENLTATTLRNIIGEMELDQSLTSRDVINAKMRSILDEATDPWGIKVNRVELKNILPPKEIQNAMEKQMKAERRSELQLFMQGERNVEKYREVGINWWDYCGSILVNSYPTYFEKLPPLIAKINRERRNSKNYVLFLGETGAESNQAPCLSLVQFQLDGGELVLSAYQRSSDANLGLPSDIYHLYLMARQIELPLKSITLYLGNVHIYENNIPGTRALIAGDETVRFGLNV